MTILKSKIITTLSLLKSFNLELVNDLSLQVRELEFMREISSQLTLDISTTKLQQASQKTERITTTIVQTQIGYPQCSISSKNSNQIVHKAPLTKRKKIKNPQIFKRSNTIANILAKENNNKTNVQRSVEVDIKRQAFEKKSSILSLMSCKSLFRYTYYCPQ